MYMGEVHTSILRLDFAQFVSLIYFKLAAPILLGLFSPFNLHLFNLN